MICPRSANVKQWNRWCVNQFQWHLIGNLVNQITNRNYVDNSGPYIETCQMWISLDLCAKEDRGEEYIVATGNMTAIQKHTHSNGAMYNADTMGYDPFPASFLPQLIVWKHDLTGNFNYDCRVSLLLAT